MQNKTCVISRDKSVVIATRFIFRPVIKADRSPAGDEIKRVRNIVIPKQRARNA